MNATRYGMIIMAILIVVGCKPSRHQACCQSIARPYRIVETGQNKCYNNWNEIECPKPSEPVNAHGAGAQRSDPKSGDPADYPRGLGPQADEIRIYNYVRCVRDIDG
jgi:hypothetical protein